MMMINIYCLKYIGDDSGSKYLLDWREDGGARRLEMESQKSAWAHIDLNELGQQVTDTKYRNMFAPELLAFALLRCYLPRQSNSVPANTYSDHFLNQRSGEFMKEDWMANT